MKIDNQFESNMSLSLQEFWNVFVHRIWAILLVAFLLVAGLFFFSTEIMAPMYKSTATLYILRQKDGRDYVYTQSDFSLAKDVVSDCNYVLKSQEVLELVISKLGLNTSSAELANQISVYNPDNTRFLEVSAVTTDPQLSKAVVDCLCEVSAEIITQSMGFDQANIYSYGSVNESRSNVFGIKTYVLVGVLAAAGMYFLFLLQQIMNTSLRTEQDVEKYLGISVLGDIPNYNHSTSRNDKNGKYYRYGRYSAGQEASRPQERGGTKE